jgi:hypothetical protein
MVFRAVSLTSLSLSVSLSLSPSLAVGCGGEAGEKPSGGSDAGAEAAAPPAFDYPLDSVLRLNHIQIKATHNSYHVQMDGNTIPAIGYSHVKLAEQLSTQGVRGLELDVHYSYFNKELRVYHEPSYDEQTTCKNLVTCLEEIKGWSDAHPAHHPLIVQIELKDTVGSIEPNELFEKLEASILQVWPVERIITPALVQGSAPSLPAALSEHGFPTLGEVRGRILFALDNANEFRDAYTHQGKDLDGRLMFVNSKVGDPFAAVAILNVPVADAEAIKGALAAGLLVRTRADSDSAEPLAGDTARRDAALASGAQIISTDYPAEAPGVNYTVQIPDGTPSRCAPVTAPSQCTSKAVEDPAFIDAASPKSRP